MFNVEWENRNPAVHSTFNIQTFRFSAPQPHLPNRRTLPPDSEAPRMKRLAASVVAFLSLVSIGVAQERAKESPQAMLSLVVTDSRGNHIPSLAKSDFQVSIGGTPVDVEKFSE